MENVSGWNTKDLESSRVDHLDVIEEECIREPDMLSKHVDSSEPDSNAAYVKPSVSTVKEPSSNANTKANLNQSRYSDYESNSEESESSENLEALSETITANIHLKQAEHDKNLEALNAARQVHINEHQKDSNAVVKMDPVPAEATRQPQNVSAPVLTPMVEVTYTAVPPQTTASVQGLPPPTVAQEPSIPSVTSMQSGNPTQQNQQSIGGPGWPGQHPCPPQPFPQMNPSQQYPCGYPMYSGTQPYSGNPPYQNQYPNPSYPLYYPNSSTNGFHPQSSWQQPTAFPPAPPVQQQPPAYFPPSGIPPAVNASTASGMSGMTKPYYSTNTYDPVVMQLLHELHQAKVRKFECMYLYVALITV